MSRINTNVASLIARQLSRQEQRRRAALAATPLHRLSASTPVPTIPSGLIASESLKAEQKATETAIGNAQQANNIIGTAEGSLSEVSNLLVSLQGLVGNSANNAGLSHG